MFVTTSTPTIRMIARRKRSSVVIRSSTVAARESFDLVNYARSGAGFGDRTVARPSPRMTAEQPAGDQPAPPHRPVPRDRLLTVRRAARRVPAHGGQPGRDALPVEPDHREEDGPHSNSVTASSSSWSWA